MDTANSDLSRSKWFYRFVLPDGRETEPYGPQKLHDDRLGMVVAEIEQQFGSDWADLSCLDIACHQGWYAYELARRGMGDVLGVDARNENLSQARIIQEAGNLEQLSFRTMDINDAVDDDLRPRDIVLMLGLIYHLEDPIGAMRRAAQLARRMLLIETQVMNFDVTAGIDWGSHSSVKTIEGVFGLIDESGGSNTETGVTGLALVPSRNGLVWLLQKAGFPRGQGSPATGRRLRAIGDGKADRCCRL